MSGDSPTPPVIPDYTLLRPIGRGSYGEVWLARSVTGVFRVIKIVHRHRFEDERPFLRELQGISRFQAAVSGRPRQLALLHVGRNEAEGYFYYVMEPADDAVTGSAIDPDKYVPLTLRELYQRRGRLPAQECIQLALELARGLAVLHGAGLIHRDIKPSNIIFVQGVPKLADVGLVAATESTLSCVGTPGYVPPEGPGSVTADIYSLGKVLYEIATGHDRHRFPEIPNDYRDDSDFPLLAEINTVVVRACAPTVEQRHPNIEAFARDLELLQAGKSLAFYEGVRRRLRVFAYVAGTIAVLSGFAAALLYWQFDVRARANEQTRRALYRSDLAVAQLAKASGDLGRARAALQRQIPRAGESDLRSLEWSILAREVQGEGQPLQPIPTGAAVSKLVADRTGRWLAGALPSDQVVLWDLRTGRIARTIDNAAILGGFTPEGELVVDEPERALRYENLSNGTQRTVSTGHRLAQLFPEGSALFIPPEGDFEFFKAPNPASQRRLSFNASKEWPLFDVAMFEASPNSRWLMLTLVKTEGAHRKRMIACVDLEKQTKLWDREEKGKVVWVRASPDNLRFSVNLGGLVPEIISRQNPSNRIALTGHSARVEDAQFNSVGTQIATASADQTIRIWDTSSGQNLRTLSGLGRPATAVAWLTGDKQIVASDDSGRSLVWELKSPSQTNSISGMFEDVNGDLIYDQDSSRIAVTSKSGTIDILTTSDLRHIATVTNGFQPIYLSSNTLFALTSDWSIRQITLRNNSGTVITSPLGKKFDLEGWSTSPNGDRFAFSGSEGQLTFVNLKTGTTTKGQDPDHKPIWALSFRPNSDSILTGNTLGKIFSWSFSSGSMELLHSIPKVDIQAIATSPDSKWLAVSVFNDSSIRIYDQTSKIWLSPRKNHRRFATNLVFTRDSKRLISGGADGRAIFWSVPNFEEIAAFELSTTLTASGDEGIAILRLAPDENSVAALSEDGRVQIWRTR